ncbi:MAG: hypothetical protein U9Q33_06570 [Campylobacterota bacterium]|nr:hypothetical protein [Campylobacterota bacterium]
MQKLLLTLVTLSFLGANSLFADIIDIYSWKVGAFGGSKAGVYVDLYDPNNYTINQYTGEAVSNDTFLIGGYTQTLVIADSFNDIDMLPLVDASMAEAQYEGYEKMYIGGKPAINFYFSHDDDMVGSFRSFYNTTPYSTYDYSRFLRYP